MTAASPGPAPVTPGQAAREAFGELGADWYPGTSWDDLHEDLRAQWEAAAQAATARHVLSGTGALMGDIIALQAERDEARTERAQLREQADRLSRQLAAAVRGLRQIAADPDDGEAGAVAMRALQAVGEGAPETGTAVYLNAIATLSAALRDIRDSYDTGTAAHDWAHKALDDVDHVRLRPPAPELAAATPEPPLEVRPGGAVIMRPEGGDTLIMAFAPDVPAERIAEVSHNLHHASGLKVIAVADIAAARVWHPHDAPAELAAAMAETRKLRELLAEVLREFDNGKGDGYRARVGQVKYNGWCERAGLDGA